MTLSHGAPVSPSLPAREANAATPVMRGSRNGLRWALGGVAVLTFVVVAHNYCFSMLPRVSVRLTPTMIRPEPGRAAFKVEFHHSPGDTLLNPRSRVLLTENGTPMRAKVRLPDAVGAKPDGTWSHFPGGILFSTADGSDPRTNGRHYAVQSPILYSRAAGYGALVILALAMLGLRRLQVPPTPPAEPTAVATTRHHWRKILLPAAIFAATLYFSTGTLAPYANTLSPIVHVETGYLYNIDRSVHRTLFAFVNGEPRAAWEDSLLLRRILHAVLARPWTSAFGYDLGGVLFNIVANLVGFAAGIAMLRRQVGPHGARLGAWLMALYPGAGYWVGQPFSYGLLFPMAIAAFWVLLELPAARPSRLLILSLALGVIYLSYDLHVLFLPASMLLLAWHRRWRIAGLSVALQLLPLVVWLALLKYVVKVPIANSNSDVYGNLAAAFFDLNSLRAALGRLGALPEIAADVFFGSNFLFLPLLALAAWLLDFSWRRLRQQRAVIVLLASAAAMFVFCNLPPPHSRGWNMQGTWIARLYQPVFPALLFLLAVWWQELRPRDRLGRSSRGALVVLALAGNALICFGPALRDPFGISEQAFYRFYDHTDQHWIYRHNLDHYGRRPLGFPRPPTP